MAIHDPKRLQDGQLSFEGGEDTGRSPTRLGRNQSALLVNCTCRGDFISQRPALVQCALEFHSRLDSNGDPYEDTQSDFEDRYFQGFHTFNHAGNDPTLLFSISGKIFEVSLFPSFHVTCIWPQQPDSNLPQDLNPTVRPQVWWEQVEGDLVWQDGQSIPLIIRSGSVIRSDSQGLNGIVDTHPKKQVPTGRAMAYVNGRLWVTLPDEISFVAGDIVGGPTGPLYFTENTFVVEGGSFKVPTNLGPIRAVRGIANLDTSLGQGPVQFLCTDGIYSCNAPVDRTTWKDLTYPINTMSLIRNGGLSAEAATLVNTDIWYRARDGWRSFFAARRDIQTLWSQTPLSSEVSAHIDGDSEELLDRASSVNWKNWLIGTCQPQYDSVHGVYHNGLTALDFSPASSLQQRDPPVWDGMWSGRKFMAMQTAQVQGVERCFVVCLSDAGKIELWELNTSVFWDTEDDGTRLRIGRAIESPFLDCGNRLELKVLDGQDHWTSEVRGTVDFSLFYRSDQSKCWNPWQAWQLCAKAERCAADAVDGCVTDLNLNPQPRPRVSAQRPPEVCETGTGTPASIGYGFQTRLEITGPCQVDAIRLFAQRADEDVYGACPPTTVTTCPESVCCGPDNVIESVT